MMYRHWRACCLLIVASFCYQPGVAQGAASAPAPPADAGPPGSMAGFADEGVFDSYRDEERLVRTKFNWRADGGYEMEAVVSLAGQSMTIKGTITPDAEGRFAK